MKKSIPTEAFALYNNKIFASDMYKNGLYVYDILERKGDYICNFPNEPNRQSRIHSNAVIGDNKVWFVPDAGQNIHVVDPKNPKDIVSITDDRTSDVRVEYAFLHKRNIISLRNEPNNNVHVFSIDDNVQYDIPIPSTKKGSRIRRSITSEGNMYYFLTDGDCCIFQLDIKERKVNKINIGNNNTVNNGFGTICLYNDSFWLSSQEGLVEVNKKTKKIESFVKYPSFLNMIYCCEGNIETKNISNIIQQNSFEQPFLSSVVWRGNVVLFPSRVDRPIALNLANKEILELEQICETEDKKSFDNTERVTHSHYIGRSEKGICWETSTATNKIYMFKGDELVEYKIEADAMRWAYLSGEMVNESLKCNINDLIGEMTRA